MTVLSRQWRVARPRRRIAVIRTSRTVRPPRRTYRDTFFADPAVVEDDARRMTRRGSSASSL
jgi:hypothetical protein